MARPTLADSLRASLEKGSFVDTAEKIKRGFEEEPVRVPEIPSPPFPISEPIFEPEAPEGVKGDTPYTPVTGDTPYTEKVPYTPNTGVTPVTPNTGFTPPFTRTLTPPLTPVSPKQGLVLDILIQNSIRFTSYNAIGKQVGMSKQGVYDAVKGLMKKGFIVMHRVEREATEQGFRYMLDEALVQIYLARRNTPDTTPYTFPYTYPDTGDRGDTPYTPSSSSSFSKETSSKSLGEIMSDREMKWWLDEGLDQGQVEAWMREFDLTSEEIYLSLCHGRFDIKAKGNVKSPKDYFYKTIEKNDGMYPRPKNYKSLRQIRAEMVAAQMKLDDDAAASEHHLDEVPLSEEARSLYSLEALNLNPGKEKGD